jgi:hypothetical protein
MRDVQPLADLWIGQSLCGHLSDLKLLCRQPVSRLGRAAPARLSGRPELPARSLTPGNGPESGERVARSAQLRARLRSSPVEAKPRASGQLRPCSPNRERRRAPNRTNDGNEGAKERSLTFSPTARQGRPTPKRTPTPYGRAPATIIQISRRGIHAARPPHPRPARRAHRYPDPRIHPKLFMHARVHPGG